MIGDLGKREAIATPMVDIASHARFFDHLVELVPARHYLAGETEHVNTKFLKKSVRDAQKAAFKQQYKQNKRAKLDPDQAKTTLQLQQQQQGKRAQAGAAESDSDDGESGDKAAQPAAPTAVAGGMAPHTAQLALPVGKPPSREELREKLHHKLELMRKQRKAEEQQEKVQQAKQWRDKKLDKGRKAAQEKQQLQSLQRAKQQQGQATGGAQQQQQGQKQVQQAEQQQQQGRKRQRDEGGLHFSKVDFGADGGKAGSGKKRKPSKAELLKAAEAKQAAVQELGGTSEGKAKLEKEAWGAALARASGKKVLDDPRLLRRSLKKEAKQKAKKAATWRDRLGKQKEQQQAKQQKRKENIEGRINARQEKRKARRENKLLRAGFEGRKEGFIATPKAG